MNNRGFTLAELLAVIVILSIIVIVAVPSYMSVSASIKESNLRTTKEMISNTMLRYADKYYLDDIKPANNNCISNNCCKYYSINYIKNNNIFAATNGSIKNPVTNEELIGYIKVSYNTTNYTLDAEYKENKNDRGNCGVVE